MKKVTRDVGDFLIKSRRHLSFFQLNTMNRTLWLMSNVGWEIVQTKIDAFDQEA